MKASDFFDFSYSVCIRAVGSYVFDRIPTAKDIYSALSSLEEFKSKRTALSDCFSKGFVYKPLSFDTVNLSSKEEYRIFKASKKAVYIEKAILDTLASPEDLTQLLSEGMVKIKDSHIYSALNGFSSPFSESIDPSSANPIKTSIKRGSLLEFYISSDAPVKALESRELCIFGHQFTVESVAKINMPKNPALLLSSMKTDKESANLPLVCFRLGFNAENEIQFFVPGSVFFSIPESLNENDFSSPAPFFLSFGT